jgi:hypothetical protein
MNESHDPTQPMHRERLLNLAEERGDHPERLNLPPERPVPDRPADEEEGKQTTSHSPS